MTTGRIEARASSRHHLWFWLIGVALAASACSQGSSGTEQHPSQSSDTTPTVDTSGPTTVASTTAPTVAPTTSPSSPANPRIGRPVYDDFVLLAAIDEEVGGVCETEYDSDMAACYDSYERGTPSFQSVVTDNLDYYLNPPGNSSPDYGSTYSPDYGGTATPNYGSSYTPDSDFNVYSPGVNCSTFGDTAYCSDGSTYTQFGDTVYGPDGDTWTQFGDTIYGPGGSTCTEFGSTVYCSP